MNERGSMIGTTALLVLLCVFAALAAFLVWNGSRQSEGGSNVAMTVATSTASVDIDAIEEGEGRSDAAGPEDSRVSRVTAATSSKQTDKPMNAYPVTVKESAPALRAASEPSGRICTANDLSGTASWTREGTYLAGTLRVKNNSSTDCVLAKASRIAVYSGPALLADRQTSAPSTGMLIPARSERPVRFTWSNWCGAALSNPGYAVFTLPGGAGYLRVPFISADGDPQYDAPACGSSGVGSTIDMWW